MVLAWFKLRSALYLPLSCASGNLKKAATGIYMGSAGKCREMPLNERVGVEEGLPLYFKYPVTRPVTVPC